MVVSSAMALPIEGVLFQTPSTKLLVNNQEIGTATLYITENNVVWSGGVQPSGGIAPTISLYYPTISLHAIQREPSPALYMVLNYELRLPELRHASGSGQGSGDDEPNVDDDDDFDVDEPITQLRFIPQNEGDLQGMYSAMNQGQSLHPDPADEINEDDPYMDGEEFDEGEDEFEDAEESNQSPEEAAVRLRQLRLQNSNGNHQYDDDAEDAGIEEQ